MKNTQKIAKERTEILFERAEQAAKEGNFGLSKRYVSLARKIGMKVQLSMPKHLKRKFCKKCHVFWIPSKTVRVRTHKTEKRVIFTCLKCNAIQRYPYHNLKKGKL